MSSIFYNKTQELICLCVTIQFLLHQITSRYGGHELTSPRPADRSPILAVVPDK